MIHYKKGDLFKTDCDIIAHGCNCRGVMGSGVAKLVRDKYPPAYNAYMEQHEGDGLKLGDVQFIPQRDDKWIANCMTQNYFMPRHVCHADYNAIRECMVKLKEFSKPGLWSIAIPKIGAGLAGGDWKIIETILNEVFDDWDVTVYEL